MVLKLNTRSKPRALRRTLDKRRAILRAAAVAFREHGIAGAGMREIALAADISPANLYYYFESKDEILYFCQDDTLDHMLEAARAARAGRRPPEEQLRAIIEAQLLSMLDELEGAQAHLEVDGLPRSLRRKIVAKRDRYEEAVRSVIQAGIRSGAFFACDATLVTRAILGALNWTARWYRPGGARTPAAIAAAFSDYLVRGLLT
jgi:AcrR family transcriptional regulator